MRRPSDYSTPWLGSAGGQGKEKPVGGAGGWRRRVVPRWVAPAGGSMERANGTSCLTSCKRATEPPAPPRNGRHPLIPPPLVSDWPTCDSLLFHHCRIHYSTPGSFSLSLFSLYLSLSLFLSLSLSLSLENLQRIFARIVTRIPHPTSASLLSSRPHQCNINSHARLLHFQIPIIFFNTIFFFSKFFTRA